MNDIQENSRIKQEKEIVNSDQKKWEIEWRNATPLAVIHICLPYAFYLAFTKAMWTTCIFALFLYSASLLGQTAGTHRLWSHKAYKAKLPLQIILLVLTTITFQGSVIHWARDHRLHHKFSDTDADPHNAKRGFFYSHIGWMLIKKSPAVINHGRSTYMKDLQSQPLLYFQDRYFVPLALLFCFVIPSTVPLLWGEKFWTAFFVAGILRLSLTQHATFSLNSAAHKWGMRPYDKNMLPADQIVLTLLMCGEGFHNFHHAFPFDYRGGELSGYKINIAWKFINLMVKIGWAYDLKAVSDDQIEKRANSMGDGTRPVQSGNLNYGSQSSQNTPRLRQRGM